MSITRSYGNSTTARKSMANVNLLPLVVRYIMHACTKTENGTTYATFFEENHSIHIRRCIQREMDLRFLTILKCTFPFQRCYNCIYNATSEICNFPSSKLPEVLIYILDKFWNVYWICNLPFVSWRRLDHWSFGTKLGPFWGIYFCLSFLCCWLEKNFE